jgi:hypothetical protein
MNRYENMSTAPQPLSNNLNAVGELVTRYGFEAVRRALELTLPENCFADLPAEIELRVIPRGKQVIE